MSSATSALPLRTIHRGDWTLQVADTHREFWDAYASGRWEPETFALFDRYLDKNTVHVDVGAWIGPTVLYAATRARQVIGFEPDPVAFASLQASVSANPNLASIEVHQVAIAAARGELRLGAHTTPGDSMSSALFAGNANSWTVPARRLDEFENRWPAGAPVFLKIDIEGGEYTLLPALADFVRRHRPTIYLSLHSHFFLGDSVNGGFFRKAWHELILFQRFLAFRSVLHQYPYLSRHDGQLIPRRRWFHRETWRRTYAVVLSHRPPSGA
jgi:FkbM family methyltransferase